MEPTALALLMEIAAATAQPTLAPVPAAPIGIAEADELAGLAPLTDEQLDEHRGGFTWQGVNIALGAEIRTYLDGELVLQTNISWSDAGAQTSQFVSAALTPAGAAELQAGILTSGGISMRVGDESVFLANDGQTALMHRTDGSIQNVLINRASNVTALQEVDATLDLGNFGQFQRDVLDARIGDALGDAVAQATIGSMGL